MRKKPHCLRPFLYIMLFSLLTLTFIGCNSSSKSPKHPTKAPKENHTEEKEQNPEASSQQPTPTPENPETSPSPIPEEPEQNSLAPLFSNAGGFYDRGFFLTLSCEQDSTVYYTTDGSDPRTSPTSKEYTNSIHIYNNTDDPNVYSNITEITLSGYQPPWYNIDKGITIRAVAKSPDGLFSPVVTNSYFVGKSAAYYTDMKVISMVTDSNYLFHEDTGIYMIGSKYYGWLNSNEYVAYDAGDVRNVTNYNSDGRENEIPVSIQVFEQGAAVYSSDIGARISGNWSRAHAQKSFRFYARKEYSTGKMKYAFFENLTDANGNLIESFDKVTLRNGGNDYQTLHFRDPLLQDLASGLACDIMAWEPCILFVNGEFWGFYMIREKTDGDYIESHYGIPKEDVAVIKNGGIEEGTESDLEEFREFCLWAASADMTQTKNYNKFCDSMDVQSFMDYMTIETYINNNDWANGSSNNWEVWHSKTVNPSGIKHDGKWRFILYDLEFSTSLYGSEGTQARYDSLNTISVGDEACNFPNMLRNLCTNDDFRQTFYDNYIRIIDTCFAPNLVNAKIDDYVSAYSAAIKDTYFRFGIDWAAHGYEGNVEQLKNFFRERPKYAKRYLDKYCNVAPDPGTAPGITSENMLPDITQWQYYGSANVYVDTTDNSLHVDSPVASINTWDIQSLACDIFLEKGCTYRLVFEASCTVTSDLDIGFNRHSGWDYPACMWEKASVTPTLSTYEYTFTMDHDTNSDWRLCFSYGHGKGDFVIKKAVLTKIAD